MRRRKAPRADLLLQRPFAARRKACAARFVDRRLRHAGDIADHLRELDVHLLKRLLDALDVPGAFRDQRGTLPDIGSELANLIGGAKSPTKEPVSVQLLNPLTVGGR
jgi:hypothetical protein